MEGETRVERRALERAARQQRQRRWQCLGAIAGAGVFLAGSLVAVNNLTADNDRKWAFRAALLSDDPGIATCEIAEATIMRDVTGTPVLDMATEYATVPHVLARLNNHYDTRLTDRTVQVRKPDHFELRTVKGKAVERDSPTPVGADVPRPGEQHATLPADALAAGQRYDVYALGGAEVNRKGIFGEPEVEVKTYSIYCGAIAVGSPPKGGVPPVAVAPPAAS